VLQSLHGVAFDRYSRRISLVKQTAHDQFLNRQFARPAATDLGNIVGGIFEAAVVEYVIAQA